METEGKKKGRGHGVRRVLEEARGLFWVSLLLQYEISFFDDALDSFQVPIHMPTVPNAGPSQDEQPKTPKRLESNTRLTRYDTRYSISLCVEP